MVDLCPFFTSSLPLCSQQHAAWIIPFFCYQIFDFVLNTLVAISVVVYPNTVQDYLQQLVRAGSDQFYTHYLLNTGRGEATSYFCMSLPQPGTFPYKEDIMSTNNMCLVFAVLIFIGCILSFKVSVRVEPVFQRCDYLHVCYGAYGVRNDSAGVDITRVLGEIIGQSESSGSGAARNQLLSSSFPLNARTSLQGAASLCGSAA